MQGWEKAIYTLSVQRPQPIERNKRKGKQQTTQRVRALRTINNGENNKKAMVLLKPAIQTPSNAGSTLYIQGGQDRQSIYRVGTIFSVHNSVIESSLQEIIGSKNFALCNLS